MYLLSKKASTVLANCDVRLPHIASFGKSIKAQCFSLFSCFQFNLSLFEDVYELTLCNLCFNLDGVQRRKFDYNVISNEFTCR